MYNTDINISNIEELQLFEGKNYTFLSTGVAFTSNSHPLLKLAADIMHLAIFGDTLHVLNSTHFHTHD